MDVVGIATSSELEIGPKDASGVLWLYDKKKNPWVFVSSPGWSKKGVFSNGLEVDGKAMSIVEMTMDLKYHIALVDKAVARAEECDSNCGRCRTVFKC